jgi:hypothetical protein
LRSNPALARDAIIALTTVADDATALAAIARVPRCANPLSPLRHAPCHPRRAGAERAQTLG